MVALKNVYVALMTSDAIGVVTTYSEPVLLAPAIMASMKPKSSTTVLYADDGAADVATAVGEIVVTLEVSKLPIAMQGLILGHTVAGGVLTRNVGDIAPFFALGFQAGKSNGSARYRWIFKGKAEVLPDDYKTKADKVDFQTVKITITFVKRDYDGAYDKIADSDDPGFLAATGTNWFTAVQGAADVTPPTVTIVPADAAAAVIVSSPVTWTFNEAIQDSCVTGANFALIADVAGTTVSGALSLDATKRIVSFTPTGNLTAATVYRAIATVGVKDLAGNPLATNKVTKFTTA
ncbi:MAG: phage major tail protein phi13 family [Bacilli bacterium]|nr:phage major tail protein phi13 family [Bacilli bacterium]